MKLWQRIALRLAEKRIIKEITKMKPLPKWVSWAALLISGGVTTGGVMNMLPPKYAAIGAFLMGVVKFLSHSATGTGGSPENP